jgi:trehalose 6-phosphate synthase/phosphatase
MGRLVVVSNRLPVSLKHTAGTWSAERSSGGLATAMDPILKKSEGMWIGWPGSSEGAGDPGRQEALQRLQDENRFMAVDLPEEVALHFYEGYANQSLWPLFHYFPSRIAFDPKGWGAYVTANELFRDAVLKWYKPGDLIWVHDYHLMLLPRMLREVLPEAHIGFFLHIPFPSSEVFRILPDREQLLEGLLGADLIAFHTHSHLQHFRSTLLRVLGRESGLDHVEVGGRAVRIEALPIGIAPEEFTAQLDKPEGKEQLSLLERRYHGRQVILGVDRMDYTKGIPERLRTYRRLLERAPNLREKVVLIQVAVPSREHIFSYDTLRREVNELIGEINGQFGTPDWTPVVYIRRGISRTQLVALYSLAHVAWISPLRDGMNLVAKEYVACKSNGDGVLVLSEFAGAAEEMGEALLVNPFDEVGTAALMETALEMPAEERRERMRALARRVRENDVFAWSEKFLSILSETGVGRSRTRLGMPTSLSVSELTESFRNAKQRTIVLDYDGTLIPYGLRPSERVPPQSLLDLLQRVSSLPHTYLLLASGRKRSEIEGWFGSVQGLWLAAEHGALLRRSGTSHWEPLREDASRDWMQQVHSVLEHFVARIPGSFVEEKEYSLVWHHRQAAARFGEWLSHELVAMLEQMLAETELRAYRGRKTVEVKPLWMHKGAVVKKLLSEWAEPDFVLALGADRTDEDVFEAVDAGAWTVHVGSGRSRARYWLQDSDAVLRLLTSLTA